MDIYDYVTQMNTFLRNQNKTELNSSNSVPANLVIRFQRATVLSVLQSRQFLAQFSSNQQVQCVEIAEQHRGKEIYDPVEDDPSVRPLYESVCEAAKQEVEAWHQQQIEKLERRSPEVAELFRSKRGLSHRYWARVKQLLWERHQIEWRSPAEMNPWRIFD
jgi:hypothetical protein